MPSLMVKLVSELPEKSRRQKSGDGRKENLLKWFSAPFPSDF